MNELDAIIKLSIEVEHLLKENEVLKSDVDKLKMQEVQRSVGISTAYLSQLETGKIDNPSFNVVRKLV